MKLFLLRLIGEAGYDSYNAHIAVAFEESEARRVVPCGHECDRDYDNRGEGHRCVWHDPQLATCEEIGITAKIQSPAVVLSSYISG